MNSQQQGILAGFRRLFGGGSVRQDAASIYRRAVQRARRPELYTRYGVADTPAGRYEMVAWQVMIELNLLSGEGDRGRRLGQEVVDFMFSDMDRSLRELGVGDMSVGREMRKLGETWQARVALAEKVLPPNPAEPAASGDADGLASFLVRNAGDGESVVDGRGLADDLLQTLARLHAERYGSKP
jgi:cytochrome b pre-mRNA-processing protein 3